MDRTKEETAKYIIDTIAENPEGYAHAFLNELVVKDNKIADLTQKNLTLAALYVNTVGASKTTGVPELGEMPRNWVS